MLGAGLGINSPWGPAPHVAVGGGHNTCRSEDFVMDTRALPVALLSITEGGCPRPSLPQNVLLEPYKFFFGGGEWGCSWEGTPITGFSGGCCIPAGRVCCTGGGAGYRGMGRDPPGYR